MLIFSQAPGKYPLQVAPATTSWVVIASDGTAYTTVALLLAAGKTPFPKTNRTNSTPGTVGLDPGMKIQSITLNTVNAGAPGSAFYVEFNPQTAPSGTAGEFIASGAYDVEPGHISQLWVSLTVAGDTLSILARY